MKVCRECGVPLAAGKGHIWRDNGVIVQRRNPDIRMIFYETDNLEDLFKGIEEIIGLPIDHIVVESIRKAARGYVESAFPPLLRRIGRRVAMDAIVDRIVELGMAIGLGQIEVTDKRFKFDDDDYEVTVIEYPRSITMYAGELLGAFEAVVQKDGTVEYEEIGEDKYRLTVRVGEHPMELSQYLESTKYEYKPGDISYERCPKCDTPVDVARCDWDTERGIIRYPGTKRRMSFYGPDPIEAVFRDLEAELGEDIPQTIVEAQRRYVKRAMQEEADRNYHDYQYMLALRGLGYLDSMQVEREAAKIVIRNPCVPPLLLGMVQGLFEVTMNRDDSSKEWEITPDGDLHIEVR